MYRREVPEETHDENQRNPADEPQFEGVVFSDGSCAVRWLTAKRSTSVWNSLDDMLAIHGHPEYGSVLVWHCDAEGMHFCPDDTAEERLKAALEHIVDGDWNFGNRVPGLTVSGYAASILAEVY